MIALMVVVISPAAAQLRMDEAPRSFSKSFQQQYEAPAPLQVEAVNRQRLLAEEAKGPGARFTAPVRVDLSPAKAGEWIELDDGGGLWRLRLHSDGALGLAVLYDRFYLPPGATLHMYSEDRRQLLGAYTSRNNKPGGQFMTGIIAGETAVLEYYEPRAVRGQGRLHIFRVDRAFRDDFLRPAPGITFREDDTGFGTSLDCHLNTACPEGSTYADQQRGIVRITVVVEEGMGFCTGTLMNNTSSDGTPYILSAYHCQDGFTPLYPFWRFDFGYRGTACDDPATEPVPNSILGCTRVAGRQENDMLLLQLTNVVPPSYQAYYCGWNREETVPESAVSLHHPKGDLLKVSTINDGISIFSRPIDWDNEIRTPADHHFDLDYTMGTFELGSSGGPLLDPDGLVVAHLHGGNPSCASTQAYYGRLALAWEGGGTPETRLSDWLDPLDTGASFLPGTDSPVLGFGALGGQVQTEDGRPLAGVLVLLDDRATATDEQGSFTFTEIPLGETYNLLLSREGDAMNGVSTLDLIRIRKHILGVDALDSPYKMVAADVNESGNISTLDIIKIQKVILGIRTQFEDTTSWRFLPDAFTFSDPDNPFADTLPASFVITNFTEDLTDLNFIGLKSGDVNGSAEPGL